MANTKGEYQDRAFDELFHAPIQETKPRFWQLRKKALCELKDQMKEIVNEMVSISYELTEKLEEEDIPIGLKLEDIPIDVSVMYTPLFQRTLLAYQAAAKYDILDTPSYQSFNLKSKVIRGAIAAKTSLIRQLRKNKRQH